MNSLFWKIFLWFWLTLIVIGMTLVFATVFASPHKAETGKWRAFLNVYMPAESKRLVEAYVQQGQAGLRHDSESPTKNAFGVLYLFNESGTELTGHELSAKARDFARTAQEGEPSLSRFSWQDPFAAQKVTASDGRKYTVLLVFPRVPFLRALGPNALLACVAVLLVGGLFCFWLARHIANPVLDVGRAASQIADGQLNTRVNKAVRWRRDEIGNLGANFDRMAQRIESLVEAQRGMLGVVSHELRSPLARLCVALGLLRECSAEDRVELLNRIELEAGHLDKLIGQLLILARIDGSADSRPTERIDIVPVVQEIAADGNFEARTRGCTVKVDSVESCYVKGVAEHLRRAIENVVRNAIRYTETNSSVEIVVRRLETSSPPKAFIQIRDHGPGVPAAHLRKVFLPFHRVPQADGQATDGAGLGLAITDRVVRMHGGGVRASNAPDGGLIVELEVPLAVVSWGGRVS